MSDFKIKSATESDVPQIVRMIGDFAEFEKLSQFCEVTAEKLSAAMFGARACVEGLIAFDNANNAVGYALFFENFASFRGQRGVYLEDLYIAPEARGAGLGLQLIKRVAQISRERGGERMDFQVLNWNAAAIRFYEKLSAQIDESERHYKIVDRDFERLANVDK